MRHLQISSIYQQCCFTVDSPMNLTFIKLKPLYQKSLRLGLSITDYSMDSDSFKGVFARLGLTNNITDSYTYFTTANPSPTDLHWDLGTMLCDSPFVGICDKLIARPDDGCSGPGCGVNSWQDSNSICQRHSDFEYNKFTRKQVDFVWPDSMYGRYYSSCDQNVTTGAEVNCRQVKQTAKTVFI